MRKVVRGSNSAWGTAGYSVHGDTVAGVMIGDQQFSYTGREFDEELGPNGLYYYRGRYYDAKTAASFLKTHPASPAGTSTCTAT